MSEASDPASADGFETGLLSSTLSAMVGVWRDRLEAFDGFGTPLELDSFGGVPGAFPYENLVYVDFDGERYVQTNVVLSGRELHVRTFTATVAGGRLTFDKLGPDAPTHVGVSGGVGIVWFVSERIDDEGVGAYAEPDMIRVDGDKRWRDTVLWRHGSLARVLHVEGERLAVDSSQRHALDPRGPGDRVHGNRSVTTNYQKAT